MHVLPNADLTPGNDGDRESQPSLAGHLTNQAGPELLVAENFLQGTGR